MSSPDELIQALRDMITHEIDLILDSDWLSMELDKKLDEREKNK